MRSKLDRTLRLLIAMNLVVVALLATEMFLSWYPLVARKRGEARSRVTA